MKSIEAFVAVTVLCAAPAAAQDSVKDRLEKSPRHQEWVAVKQGTRTVHAFVVFPEVPEKALSVIVIHENRGLTDWVRSVADRIAEAGYVAIAPDLLSGSAPGGGKTSDFPNEDAAREGISKLEPEQVTADLNAVADYVAGLPASNGKVAVAGFCWGGAQTFRFATNRKALEAAFVFYGTGPNNADDIARIQAPVYGFYGGADARVNATIPDSESLMKAAGKTYEPVIYDGAGHAFLRSAEMPDASEPNKKAAEASWERLLELLEEHSGKSK